MSLFVALLPIATARRRIATIAVALVAVAIFCWLFPLWHVVRLDEKLARQKEAAFDALAFAQKFWSEKLLLSLDRAADLNSVLTAAAAQPPHVRQQFGRTVGMSRAYFLFVRGSGIVKSIEKDRLIVALDNPPSADEIALETGPLFGNAVRDATGLLNPSDFPNSRQFNDLSSALNSIIETKVIAPLKAEGKIGSHVQFVGCAEITSEASDYKALSIVPVQVKLQ